MAIEQANPLDGLEEIDEDSFQEEDSQYNFRELMDAVLSADNNDIIFSVPTEHVEPLKQGLIRRKSKDNAKMKNSGLRPDDKALSFLAYPRKDANGKDIPGEMDVRVKLRPRRGIKLLDMRIPDDL